MTVEILQKIREILDDSGLFDAVVIGEKKSAKAFSKSNFASIDESPNCEDNECLGLFVRRYVRAKIAIRAYRTDPYESASILETITLSDAVEDLLAAHPTLGGIVQTARLESIRSAAVTNPGSEKPAAYRERVLNYVFSILRECDAIM